MVGGQQKHACIIPAKIIAQKSKVTLVVVHEGNHLAAGGHGNEKACLRVDFLKFPDDGRQIIFADDVGRCEPQHAEIFVVDFG